MENICKVSFIFDNILQSHEKKRQNEDEKKNCLCFIFILQNSVIVDFFP